MTLGDLIARLDDPQTASDALFSTGDIALIARVQNLASAQAEPVGDFLTGMIGVFGSVASADDWMAVVSAANKADPPGGACLRAMLACALDHVVLDLPGQLQCT
jgi:hypothetical protein